MIFSDCGSAQNCPDVMRYEPTVLDISLRTIMGSTEFDNGVREYEVYQVMSLCPALRVYRRCPSPIVG